jgi:hypothetical protein
MTDYGLSQSMRPDDERQEQWAKERAERGFDDTETWNLNCVIAKFLVPRLEAFKERHICHPSALTMEEWDCVLQKIIDGFKEMENYDDITNFDYDKVRKGLKLFRKWYFDLWW